MVSFTVASVGVEPLPRKSYSVKDKREFVQAVNALVALLFRITKHVLRLQACLATTMHGPKR